MKKFLTLLFLAAAWCVAGGTFTVDPANAVIVADPKGCPVAQLAASELQYFVEMMTGKKIPIAPEAVPGKYIFLFEKPAKVRLKPEEAVWETSEKMTRFYGDSTEVSPKTSRDTIFRFTPRTGDLTAVYDFLEQQLSFRFLAPGKLGTSYVPAPLLTLKTGRNSWDPGRLVKRGIRSGAMVPKSVINNMDFPEFYRKKALTDLPRRNYAVRRWLKQMRMGSSVKLSYGHAFTRWWKKYGAAHPEYFALHKGKRAPWGDPANIKMCPSNRAFINKIVENWKNSKPRPAMINVCENDWGNYCECAGCRKLDAPLLPGKSWDTDLTDRYLWMANEVIKEARKIDPKVKVGFYAYSVYRFPPRRFKVEPGIVIGFVPHMSNCQKTDEMYKAWRDAGAVDMFQRPNDQHINTGLPMGIEAKLFEHFQVGYKNGIFGTDYDSLHGFWGATGVADYILARAHVYPERTFEEHFNEYCAAYGEAASEVKAYYTYWRTEVYEKRLVPNRAKIAEKGRYGNFRRGLMWDLPKYYFEKDFTLTHEILARGLKKKLNSRERELLEQLILSNEHGRLSCRAMSASAGEKLAASKALYRFRKENWDKINFYWYRLFSIESNFGDVAGAKLAASLERFSEGKNLPVHWFFTPDPDNAGDAKDWKSTPYSKGESCWEKVSITTGWENPGNHAHPALQKMMKNYDGTGWYSLRLDVPARWKGKKIWLLFGAVDESAWIYLNGKSCGERIFKESDDWKKPFQIRIDENIDWSRKFQSLVVKVCDKGGQGGIWRPVVLAAE